MGAGGPSKQQAKRAKYRADAVRKAEEFTGHAPRPSPKASPSASPMGSPRTSHGSKERAAGPPDSHSPRRNSAPSGSQGSRQGRELAAADCQWHRRHCLDGDFQQAHTIREAYPFDDTERRGVRGPWSESRWIRDDLQIADVGPKKIYCDACGVFIVGRDGNCSFYFCRKCRDQGRKLELCVKCYRKGELGSGPRTGPANIFETPEEQASKRGRSNSCSNGPPSTPGSGHRLSVRSGGRACGDSLEVTDFCDENGVRRPVSPLQPVQPRGLFNRVSTGCDYNANLGVSSAGVASYGAPLSARSGHSGVSSVGTVGAASVNAKRCTASYRSRSSSDDSDEEQPRRPSRVSATSASTSLALPARPPTGEWKGTITEEGITRSTIRQLRFAEGGTLTGTQTDEGCDVAISGAFVANKRKVSWVEVHSWGRVKFDGHVTWSSGKFIIKGTFVTTDESKGTLELTRPP